MILMAATPPVRFPDAMLFVFLAGDVSEFGYYAGGARFEYGEKQGPAGLTAGSMMARKLPEGGGEI
jgi:hypothetical protein